MSQKRLEALLLVAVVTLTYGVPLVLMDSGFVFDDHRFVRDNQAIRDLSDPGRFFTDLRTVDPRKYGGIYRPLRTLDFAVGLALFGESPRLFHLESLLWFLGAAFLLRAVFLRWGAPPGVALAGTLVFVLHPVQVESAAWITSRGDLLCLVFLLGALLLHSRDEGFSPRFLLASLLLALALLSKEAAVIFAGAAFLGDFFFRDGRSLTRTLARWPRYLVYLVLAGAYVVLWVEMHRAWAEPGSHLLVRWGGSLGGTLLLMARGLVYYARLLFLPADTAIDYYLAPAGLDLLTTASILAVLAVVAAAVRAAVRRGGFAPFAVLWFLLAILPAANLVAPLGIPTAERFLLLPMVGVSLALGALLVRVDRAGPAGRPLVVTALVLLAALSFDRARDFSSDERLWGATLARFESPRGLGYAASTRRAKAEALRERAQALRDRNRTEEAEAAEARATELLREAIALHERQIEVWRRLPDGGVGPVARAHADLSVCRFALAEHEAALELANRALSVRPPPVHGHFARALALSGLGRLPEAAREADRTVELDDAPRYRRAASGIVAQLARQYDEEGNRALAFLALRRAWDLHPDPVENEGVLRALREMEEDLARLEGEVRRRIAADPADAEPRLQLATLYSRYGRFESAEPLFEDLLAALGPDPRVLFPYALYFWQGRDTDEGYRKALELYRDIERRAPGFPGVKEEMRRCEERLARP